MKDGWYPGPLSHPYPGVSSCRTQAALNGDPRVPLAGLPDCQSATDTAGFPAPPVPGRRKPSDPPSISKPPRHIHRVLETRGAKVIRRSGEIGPEDAEAVCDRIAGTGALDETRARALEMVEGAKRGLPWRDAALELVADGVVERYA